jgi:hypothetical protein
MTHLVSSIDQLNKMEDERIQKLREVLSQFEPDHNKLLEFADIHRFLSKKAYENTGEKFSFEICHAFFQMLGRSEEDSVTINELVSGVLALEQTFVDRISEAQSEQEEL